MINRKGIIIASVFVFIFISLTNIFPVKVEIRKNSRSNLMQQKECQMQPHLIKSTTTLNRDAFSESARILSMFGKSEYGNPEVDNPITKSGPVFSGICFAVFQFNNRRGLLMKNYIIFSTFLLTACLYLFCAGTKTQKEQAVTDTDRIRSSIDVLKSIVSIPEKTIPADILDKAQGIAVIPGVLKAAFVAGGSYGQGVATVKTSGGTWSYPGFLGIEGGSVGWQWGVESIDLVLVFMTRKSTDTPAGGEVTLGVNAAVAASPIGRQAQASTELQSNADILSYARAKGLFLGVSFDGAKLSINNYANQSFYKSDTLSAQDIFTNNVPSAPPQAMQFINEVDTITAGK